MGDHDIVIDGVPLKVKVVDCAKVVDDLIPHYFNGQDVFGLDFKVFRKEYNMIKCLHAKILIISAASRCLVIHMGLISKSLKKFLEDSKNCFVLVQQAEKFPSVASGDELWKLRGVGCCELAYRVLKNPGLKKSGVKDIAQEVGVTYEDAYASSSKLVVFDIICREKYEKIVVDDPAYDKVLTTEEVKMVVYDPFKCYTIASKLLSSLK
ncbi:hypothetical protein SOVF_215120 [Spinacia oleracea]|nr:hypothetical protein SOVF_215120 [Spinacia oleracea]